MTAERPNSETQNITLALRRASKRARQLARQTRTGVAYVENGKIVTEVPASDESESSDGQESSFDK